MIHPAIPRALLPAVLALLAVAAGPARADDPQPPPPNAVAVLERLWPGHPEALAMFVDILQGSTLGPEDGWFRQAVARSRYDWKGAAQRLDRDGDGRIARAEFPGPDADFRRLDRDGDGGLTAADFDFSAHALAPSMGMNVFFAADADGNGKLTRDEVQAFFARADRDGQGYLSLTETQDLFTPPRRPAPAGASGPGSPAPSPSFWARLLGGGGPDTGEPGRLTLLKGLFTQEIGSLQRGPRPGEVAPDFTLRTVADGSPVTLSEQIGPRPVVLVFGNFTCGPFRSRAGDVEKLYRAYGDRATFLMVYVREAHPTDGWETKSGRRYGIQLAQPRSYDERRSVAQTCADRLSLGFPMLVDDLNDRVGARYSGMPSRLYVIDRTGTVAYQSGRGPFGFKPRELEQSLLLVLAESEGSTPAPAAAVAPSDASRP